MSYKSLKIFFILLLLSLNSYASEQHSSKIIRIVGSSTIFPFMATAIETFKNIEENIEIILEANGTGGGVKLFCNNSLNSPDIVNASRKISNNELSICKQNNITDVKEVILGMDGIVFVVNPNNSLKNLSTKDLYHALSNYFEKNGEIIKNPYKFWDEVNPKLAHIPIKIYGPPVSSGTRETLINLILQKKCNINKSNYNKLQQKIYCSLIREDGLFVDVGENDNLIAQKINMNKDAVGIIGFNFLQENQDSLKALTVNNIKPTFENISTKKYPVSRPLYVYFNYHKLASKKYLKDFYDFLNRKEVVKDNGILMDKGLVPIF